MKKLFTILLLTPFFCNSGAQVYDDNEDIVIFRNDDVSTGVFIRLDEKDKNGFSIAVAGYEIGMVGKTGFDPVYHSHPHYHGHVKKHKQSRRYRGFLGVFEFGFNGLTDPSYRQYADEEKDFLELRNGKSNHVSINLFRASKGLNRSNSVGFCTGLGMVWNNLAFDENITIVKDGGMLRPVQLDKNYKKSKLTTFAFRVPLLLEFSNRNYFFSGGVYGDLVLASHTKYKKPKHKSHNGSYIDMFQAGVTARTGFRWIYVFGNYALTDMFKSGKAPSTNLYTIGVGLKLW